MSQKGLVRGRPFINKGRISGKPDVCFPETFPQDLLPSPELTAADGNKPRNTQMVWSTNVVNSCLLHFNKTQEVRKSDDWTIWTFMFRSAAQQMSGSTLPCVIINKENTTFKTTFSQFTTLHEKWVVFSRFVTCFVNHYTCYACNCYKPTVMLRYTSYSWTYLWANCQKHKIKDLQSMITGRTFPDSGKGI